MAKKSIKRQRAKKSKSFFQKLLTFPKLVTLGVVVLSALTIYQVTLPTTSVLGESTVASDISYKLKLNMYSIGRTSDKSCLAKVYKVKVTDANNNSKTYVAYGNKDCTKFATPTIKLKGKCNWVSYESNLANWSLFEIKYSDSRKDPGYVYNSKKVQVCYSPPNEGLSVPALVNVEFGMKAK